MNKYENEYSRKNDIEKMLIEAGWNIYDIKQAESYYCVKNENVSLQVDYVLLGNDKKPLAVIEVKRNGSEQSNVKSQVLRYAESLKAPFIFYTIGDSIYFWDYSLDDAHMISSFYSREDLERILYIRNKRTPLSFDKKMILPYHYQEEIIFGLINTANSGKRRSLVELAPGLGKTNIALLFIERLIVTNSAKRFLILVDSTNEAYKLNKRIYESFRGLSTVCVLKSDYNLYEKLSADQNRIIISTFQTMSNQYERFTSGHFDVVITLECSSIVKSNWYMVLNHFDAFHIGFSSIPVQLIDSIAWKFFGLSDPSNVEYKYSLTSAINDGYLVPARVYNINYRSQHKEQYNSLDIESILFAKQNSEKMMIELDKLMWQSYHQLADSVSVAPGKGLVFAASKAQAIDLTMHLNKLHPEYNDNYAKLVTSDISDVSVITENFISNKLPIVLVSVNMLLTGFDFPELLHIAICRNVKNPAQYYQIISKGMRRAVNIGKREFAVYDFTNSYFHLEKKLNIYEPIDVNLDDIDRGNKRSGVYDNNLYIVSGAKVKRISAKSYILKWEKTIKIEAKYDPIIQKIINGIMLTDKESELLYNRFSSTEWRFNEENLGLAYNKPGDTLEQFIRVALGKSAFKTKESELEDKFVAWLVSKNATPEQSQYLHILKNICLNRGNLHEGILIEPQFHILNLNELGKDLFGEVGFSEILEEINQIIYEK